MSNIDFKSAFDLMPTDAASKKLLLETANIFAKQLSNTKDQENKTIYIKFKLSANDSYGISYQHIKEIISNFAITKLPYTSEIISGIIYYRGSILTTVNLKKLFNLTEPEDVKNHFLIIVFIDAVQFAILVQDIICAEFYEEDKLIPPLDSGTAIKKELILGLHQGKTAIIDLQALKNIVKQQNNGSIR